MAEEGRAAKKANVQEPSLSSAGARALAYTGLVFPETKTRILQISKDVRATALTSDTAGGYTRASLVRDALLRGADVAEVSMYATRRKEDVYEIIESPWILEPQFADFRRQVETSLRYGRVDEALTMFRLVVLERLSGGLEKWVIPFAAFEFKTGKAWETALRVIREWRSKGNLTSRLPVYLLLPEEEVSDEAFVRGLTRLRDLGEEIKVSMEYDTILRCLKRQPAMTMGLLESGQLRIQPDRRYYIDPLPRQAMETFVQLVLEIPDVAPDVSSGLHFLRLFLRQGMEWSTAGFVAAANAAGKGKVIPLQLFVEQFREDAEVGKALFTAICSVPMSAAAFDALQRLRNTASELGFLDFDFYISVLDSAIKSAPVASASRLELLRMHADLVQRRLAAAETLAGMKA